MFLGGDQYRNDLSNNLIIKCHECGDTNLRYVGTSRTFDAEKPYICGNGHTTWGALDDWSVRGQTDTVFSEVKDCCCEGVECEFPKSIKVNFSGLIGVQAREQSELIIEGINPPIYRFIDNLTIGIQDRTYNPLSMCPPCFSFDTDYEKDNGPWSFNCGGMVASGTCRASDDSIDFNPLDYCEGCEPSSAGCEDGCFPTDGYCVRTIKRISFEAPGTNIVQGGECPTYQVSLSYAGDACTNFQSVGTTITAGSLFSSIPDIGGPTFIYETQVDQSNPPYDPCPEKTQEFYGSPRDPYSNIPPSPILSMSSSMVMVILEGVKIKSKRTGPFSTCYCVSIHRQAHYLYRTHPTSDNNALSGWSLSQDGINPAYQDMTYSAGTCPDCDYDDPGLPSFKDIDLAWFCNTSNDDFSCTDCRDSVTTNSDGIKGAARSIWPRRIPAFESAGAGETQYQLIRNDQNNFDGAGFITARECGCRDVPTAFVKQTVSPLCPTDPQPSDGYDPGEPPADPTACAGLTNTDCEKYIYYPSCFEKGNLKCSDVDSKFRIECDDPDDFFSVQLNSLPFSLPDNRYTLNVNTDPKYWCGLWQLSVRFQPEWVGRITVPRSGIYGEVTFDAFQYPEHPNPECESTAGAVLLYGVPSNPEVNNPNIPFATGLKSINLDTMVSQPNTRIEQPHCLRRVMSPSVSNYFPYWAVNTADISNQTLILDRYYPTGPGIDYAWSGVALGEEGLAEQTDIANKGDLGLSDYSNGNSYPFPFIAHSGSLEEPELIAIIHSESGVGAQIAFQTFPVSYDTDELVDIGYDILKPNKGTCLYKHRITAHGYGVMYPLIDDPLWKEEEFEYPVILAGSGYEIGDKIEFRCWKCLEDADERDATPGENEEIWQEECMETVIATATITELNDERVAPEIVDQILDGIISVVTKPKTTDRYYETYTLETVDINHTGVGYDIDDIINISFIDSDTRDGTIHYDTQPYITVTETGVGGVILDFDITESGEFYKVVGNGGVRWYEFDETDGNGDLLISVGNCPCEYDICDDPDYTNPNFDPNVECKGCISRSIYPTGHLKLDALPRGFPSFPNLGCLFNDDDPPISQICNGTNGAECSENCQYTYNCSFQCSVQGVEVVCPIVPSWILLNDDDCLQNNCACGYPESFPENATPGEKTSAPCSCSTISYQFLDPAVPLVPFVGPFSNGGFEQCFPLNNTWDFYEQNYARSACSGEPETPEQRPYIDGITVMPAKKAQYKMIWLPKVNEFKQEIESKLPPELSDAQKNAVIDQFLSLEPCNPLKLDRFNKSYKFPNFDFVTSNAPCRKSNPGDSLPIDHERTIDDYCRVYGFYQQRQPSCEVVYKGQYILRAAQKDGFGQPWSYRDCEPIIEDIVITLKKKEAKIDISVGAPYDQDFLIPENLPLPYMGADGKLEVTADAWNEPSLIKTDNERFFDHGFFEPARKAYVVNKEIPNESEDENDLIPTAQINPSFTMYDIDGQDYETVNDEQQDYYIEGEWDLPDPRSNIRIGTSGLGPQDECTNPVYTGIALTGFPVSGIRNSFIVDCPYPWENYCADSPVGGEECDFYCMFKNNSAEIVVSEIEECEYCTSSETVKYDRFDYVIMPDRHLPMPESFFHYTYRIPVDYQLFDNDEANEEYLRESFVLFRCYGSSEGKFDRNTIKTLIDNYINIWIERKDIDPNITIGGQLLSSLNNDIEQRIFSNFIFQGANNNQLENLTKMEIYFYDVSFPSRYVGDDSNTGFDQYKNDFVARITSWSELEFNNFSKVYEESRCLYPKKGGAISELIIQNSGQGYAFEIEERVPPSGVIQNIDDAEMVIYTTPKERKRRRETYAISGVDINHSGTGYSVDEIITIGFNDSDYRRNEIFINTEPTIRITGVDESGKITGWTIENSGEFYKYVGTDEHRAFPIAIVLNNYWNELSKEGRQIGKNAILRPVVGVDPEDPVTYGKIKDVKVEYGGIDYVEPMVYWTIDTKTGKYNSLTGDLVKGLDIHHLVDPTKFIIDGDGMSIDAINNYKDFINPNVVIQLPSQYEDEILYPEQVSTNPDYPFEYTTKYYYHTGADTDEQVIKWHQKTEDWQTVIYSGSCPFGKDGLLNRTYKMALVEEAVMTAQDSYIPQTPIIGICDDKLCDSIINSDSGCGPPSKDSLEGFRPDDESYSDCSDSGCNVFTVYDAHRYPIAYSRYSVEEAYNLGVNPYASPRPYIQGCLQQYPISDVLQPAWCGSSNGQGFVDFKVASNPSDKCIDCEYSLFAEFSKIPTSNPGKDIQGIVRGKSITYKMQDPITMSISFNDDEHEEYLDSLTCPTGIN